MQHEFDKINEKLSSVKDELDEIKSQFKSEFKEVNSKIDGFLISITKAKNDITWIKWVIGLSVGAIGTIAGAIYKSFN